MMQQMRENTKWIMLVTALAFVALMVFEWGMDMSGGSAAQFTGGELGSVNGEAITYQEFSQVYRTLYEQRQQERESPVTTAENREIEDEAWNQLIMDRLIRQELRRRGIRVTDEEIRQAARYAPPPEFYQYEMFQTDGQFDLTKYHQFLGSPAADADLLRDLESYYRRVLPRTKLFQQVGAAVVVTDGELWRLYRERNETATVRYVGIDPRQVVSDAEITVADREIAGYYSGNRQNFERPARAEVRVVSIDKAPTAADTAATLERARAVRQEILGGADFGEVAGRESADEGSAPQGGALGTVRRTAQMEQPFEDAVWRAPIGEVTEPVQTRFGYHLIRVDRRTEEEAEVSHILIPVERTLESEDGMLARVDSLESMVERMSLEAAAEAIGASVRTTELNRVLPTLPGVGSVSEGADWVFDERPAPGEVSAVFENDRRFYVLELVEREEARTLTLEEATPSIRTILMNQKKRERARDIGRQVVDQLRGGARLDAAAQAAGLTVREAGPFTRLDFVPGIGSANAAIGASFGLEVGETSGLIETTDAFYVVEVRGRTEADRAAWESQKAGQRQQVAAALQNQRLTLFVEALRKQADIDDERDRVLRAPAAAAI
ncbi:MAG TPA: SurA N-terminal domain-containing protein [Longimicrobiales bacterium]|nr:SurA N-terminal domain-containing protein [Longimicrobiales bacterium]